MLVHDKWIIKNFSFQVFLPRLFLSKKEVFFLSRNKKFLSKNFIQLLSGHSEEKTLLIHLSQIRPFLKNLFVTEKRYLYPSDKKMDANTHRLQSVVALKNQTLSLVTALENVHVVRALKAADRMLKTKSFSVEVTAVRAQQGANAPKACSCTG